MPTKTSQVPDFKVAEVSGVANASAQPAMRRFIGWDTPILRSTVEELFQQYAQTGNAKTWDMREVVVVLPGGLARRRLAELLAQKAEQTQTVLYPPKMVTVGALPEQLYTAKFPFASDVVQHLAWMHVLLETPPAELELLVPAPPAKSMTIQWLELSKTLATIHRELASEKLNFAAVAEALGNHPERDRWNALADIQRRYLAFVDSLGLWDIQTARLCALQFGEAAAAHRFIVVACVDLNQTQRGFLDAIASQVEVWIAAPESSENYFDALGCLLPDAWASYELNVPPEHLYVGGTPADQAKLTASCLAELGDAYHVRELTVGVPDSSLIAELQFQLEQVDLHARYGPGTALAQSEPATLLSMIGKFLEGRSYRAFATLIRHPAIEILLRARKVDLPDRWLADIDDYYQAVLPKTVDGHVDEALKEAQIFRTVVQAIDGWLAKISTKPQPISSFVQPLLAVMAAAYEREKCNLDDPVEGPTYAAAKQTADAILTLREIPENLQPVLTAAELIDWLVGNMRGKLVPAPTHAEAVEMLGWLELSLDDAPALIVTGMHDGVVPESLNSDAFLPNGLRRQLGMMDNARRYARDSYSMQVILKTRRDVRFVVGMTDATGDPIVPSRLLMACPLRELPGRVLHLASEEHVDTLPPVQRRWQQRGGATALTIPRPDADVEPPTKISVTAFRDYLSCPYRFYLRQVLRLRSDDDTAQELNAPQFGNLIHDTLALLKGPIGQSTSAEEVEKFLIERLHEIAAQTYGANPAVAVLIQIEQAEQRLAAFAEQQAKRAEEGWEIHFVEQGTDEKDAVMVGRDRKLKLIGRIDRIDYHPQRDAWAIWDYKTSDTPKKPVSVHWSRTQGWRDLQLPLYRKIAEHLGVIGQPSVGYIALPKQAAGTAFVTADFSAEQLREADETAAEIATKIADGEFWPDEIGEVDYDDFARICQSNIQRVTVPPPQPGKHRTDEAAIGKVSAKVVADATKLLAAPQQSSLELTPLLIRASAGTGKTFQLSNRLLQIVLAGHDVDPILATTFTRKAAGEIMNRVLQRLAQGCVTKKSRDELAQHLPGVDCSAANCLASLRKLTASIHRLRISTLDSFFAQVARTFSLEMSLPPGWNAMDPVQEPQFQLQAVSRMLDNRDRRTLVNLVRMLAKGESTRQVAEEVLRTVNSGFGAYRITQEETWDQLKVPSAPSESAIESALQAIEGCKLGHKSADKQLEQFHLLARTGDWENMIQHGVFKNLADASPTYYGREIPADLAVALEVLAERAAAELLAARRNQTLASYKVLAAYDQEYTALVKQYRSLGFADITHYLSRWMAPGSTPALGQTAEKTPASDAAHAARQRLEFRLDCGVQHLLLDEFQDTAPEQWRILEPLAKPLVVGPAKAQQRPRQPARSMFCVGDTKQAIYGWRGGVAEVFDSVTEAMPGIKQQELQESYRSSPEVMLAVNAVFENLTEHPNFGGSELTAKRWSERFPEHRTARKDLVGYVRLQNAPDSSQDASPSDSRLSSLDFTANQIAELTAHSSASVGVLFRTNADVGKMIALLRDKGVSASQDGGNSLMDSSAVQLVMSLVHLADHPGDSICHFHVATSPLAQHLRSYIRRTPNDPERLPLHRRDSTKLASWMRRQVARCGLGRTIETIAHHLANELSWWDQHRLEQLTRLAHDFQASFRGRLCDFEDAVEFQRVALPTEAQVKVMTIHKSKGLEFDAVFLPELSIDMVDVGKSLLVMRGDNPCEPPTGVLRYMNARLQELLPTSWQDAFGLQKHRKLSESLCMLYVAMTRARRALYMTTPPAGKSPNQRLSSLLQTTLGLAAETDAEQLQSPEAVLYEIGDPHWLSALPPQPKSGEKERAKAAASAEQIVRHVRLRKDAESSPQRGMRVAAPSYIHQASHPVPISNVFSFSHSVGATYGTLIHALFEQVHWLEDFEFNRSALSQVAMSAVTPEELQLLPLERLLTDFEEMLQLTSVRAALSRDRYARFGYSADSRSTGVQVSPNIQVSIDNERIISLVMENQLISGTIDRLALITQDGKPIAAEIIDFKTDKFDADMPLLWLDERVEHHRSQLEIYAQVVAKLFGIPAEKISTYLVMLSSDDLVQVDRRWQGPHFDTAAKDGPDAAAKLAGA